MPIAAAENSSLFSCFAWSRIIDISGETTIIAEFLAGITSRSLKKAIHYYNFRIYITFQLTVDVAGTEKGLLPNPGLEQ